MAKHTKKHGMHYGSVQSHKIEDYDAGITTASHKYNEAAASVRRIGPRGSGHLGTGGDMKAGGRNRVSRGRRGR